MAFFLRLKLKVNYFKQFKKYVLKESFIRKKISCYTKAYF